MMTIINDMQKNPARWGSVAFGWGMIWYFVLRAGYRVDSWLQQIEDGERGFFR